MAGDKEDESRGEVVGLAGGRTRDHRGDAKDRSTTVVVCWHCNRTGHEATNCFQVVGYPEWWGDRPRSRGRRGQHQTLGGKGTIVRANAAQTSTTMHKKRSAPMKGGDTRETRLEQPWLLYFEGIKNQTFCNISDPSKTYSISIPELCASRICTVEHGWYLLENFISKYVSHLFLFNPYNLKKINLPPLKHNGNIIGDCVLSSSPTACGQVCSIFLFSIFSPFIFYCQLGDDRWIGVGQHKDIVRASAMMCKCPFISPVYCNGCLYAGMLTSFGFTLVIIDTLQPNGLNINLTLALMQPPPLAEIFKHICKLLISNNVLFRIEILHEKGRVTAVAVYRFDSSQRVWEKVESIQDRVFFIASRDSSLACQAIYPQIEGGRIYIALEDNNFFYIYNIENDSLVISQPFSNNLSKNWSYYSRWFIPDIRTTAPVHMHRSPTSTLKEEIGKAHQIREKKSICGSVLHLKEAGDKALIEFPLPLDVVEVIAKHLLDVFDYLHFRATSRLFRQAAPLFQWRSSSYMSMSRFNDLSLSPLFVFLDKDKVFTFVHPKRGLKYKYIINFPAEIDTKGRFWNLKSDSEICYSKDGWLLLVPANASFPFFFNPFTKEVLPLPSRLKDIWNTRCVGFSHSPTSSECVMIHLYKAGFSSKMTTCIINFLWEDIQNRLTIKANKFPVYNINPCFHNGLFYYLGIKGKLAAIEVTRGGASWKEFEELQVPCSSYFNSFLVECDGNLLSVFEGSFGKWVQVFMLNESTMTWIKVERLENHMLFVGNTSFSAVANIPGMENKIYFPRFYGQSIVFYSLETNHYHTFENEVVINFHHVTEHMNSSWIEPRCHQVSAVFLQNKLL